MAIERVVDPKGRVEDPLRAGEEDEEERPFRSALEMLILAHPRIAEALNDLEQAEQDGKGEQRREDLQGEGEERRALSPLIAASATTD